jgi:signal transduction histidine kinase
MKTEFAPAERASDETIQRQFELIKKLPFAWDFLDAMPTISMVLNAERQMVFANRAYRLFGGIEKAESQECDHAEYLGKRPGEAVGCIRNSLTAGGCGTTVFCRTCGAVQSIINSQKKQLLDVQECRVISGEANESLDFRVWARPMMIEGESFTVFSIMDISDEKRRAALERIFFHDVLNTAGNVKGLADMLAGSHLPEGEMEELAGMLSESAEQLVEEITAQRVLSQAECRKIQLDLQPVSAAKVLSRTMRQLHSMSSARGIKLMIDPTAKDVEFRSDPVLVRRVMINLVKNAVEASEHGDRVTSACYPDGDAVCFTVYNAAVMPDEVQRQIFVRSFSTKGVGRGLGTYSIRLITEQYLGGSVSFVSAPGTGTTFTLRLPIVCAESEND